MLVHGVCVEGGTKRITLGSIFCLYLAERSGDLNQCSQACVASTSVTEPRLSQPTGCLSLPCLILPEGGPAFFWKGCVFRY